MTATATRTAVAAKFAVAAARKAAAKLTAWADRTEAAVTARDRTAAAKGLDATVRAALTHIETIPMDDVLTNGLAFAAPKPAAHAPAPAAEPATPADLPTTAAAAKVLTRADLDRLDPVAGLKPDSTLSLAARRTRLWQACLPAPTAPPVLDAAAALAAALGCDPATVMKAIAAAGLTAGKPARKAKPKAAPEAEPVAQAA
jgi:hypothetical protein